MFTSHPVTGEPKVLIEAGYGLGEAVVGGQITPDTYVVDQKTLQILDKKIATQAWKYTRAESGHTVKVDIPGELQSNQKLSDELIIELAKLGVKIEEHYKEPMDVEWCVEKGKVYIVQARPVTTIKPAEKPPSVEVKPKEEAAAPAAAEGAEEVSRAVEVTSEQAAVEEAAGAGVGAREGAVEAILLRGLAAAPGIGVGEVALVSSAAELDKVTKGKILVTTMTSPDMVPAMKRASAIVTNEGGMTCHAAIVSRELGIPCIVGTGNATEVLADGMSITVDANVGVVYEGVRAELLKAGERRREAAVVGAVGVQVPITATKVLVNLGVPEAAERCAALPVQGVGLMREEFVVGTHVGVHPNALIERGEAEKFVDALVEGMAQVARAFYPRPVIMRTSDFKTNEYRELKGGEKYEPHEANPMIGWRGCSRYVSPQFEEAFRLELRAVKKIREELGLKNLWIMLPFVRTVEETRRILEIMKEEGLERSKDFKVWLMAEVPSNIFLADKFAELVDGFSIGSNDLTQLIMGADRDSEFLGKMGYFDERNEAVTRAIECLIKTAHEKGCTVSICGQAPSVYPEFTEFLIRCGIDSISLNPDTVIDTIKLIAQVEQKILLERLGKYEKTTSHLQA
jgi:pyruvate,water dikinase